MKHPALSVIEETMHTILSARGFKKQKLAWRRTLPELVQVVGLEKMTFGPMYNLCYGLSLFKFSDNPRPSVNQTHIQWMWTDKLGKRIPDITLRRPILDALILNKPMKDQDRAAHTEWLLTELVLPVFDATATIDDLRRVLHDHKHYAYTLYNRFDLKAL